MRRCQWCKNGLDMMDGETPFVMCALTPPTPLTVQRVVATGEKPELVTDVRWVRPSMTLKAWCGQFRLSVWKLLRHYGARA